MREMLDVTRRFIFAYGGSSSAKSYSIAQAILIVGCLFEKSNTLVFRKVSANIEKSIYKDFQTIVKDLGLEAYFTFQRLKIKCYNGSVIDFSGIDDPEKIKGISSYKRVLLEELSEFDFADFKQVRKRLRGRIGQQILSAFNPIDIDHWIKTEVFDNEIRIPLPIYLNQTQTAAIGFSDIGTEFTSITEKWQGDKIIVEDEEFPPNLVVLKSTYKNNFWVVGSPCGYFGFRDIQTIADFDKDRREDFEFYSIYALGNWGKLNRGGEAYKKFSNKKHVLNIKYNPEKSLHLSFDENVNPFMTLNIHQGDGNVVSQIDEICLIDPRNTLDDTLDDFIGSYPNNGNTIYIYGDATSKKQDVKLQKGKNFYTLIENRLKLAGYTTIRRLPTSNPNPEIRINWINKLLGENLDGITIQINESCLKTIADYNYLKIASDGSKYKEKARHPVTKVTYEKYGHNTDANDYFYCMYFAQSFNKFKNPRGSKKRIVRKKSVRKGY